MSQFCFSSPASLLVVITLSLVATKHQSASFAPSTFFLRSLSSLKATSEVRDDDHGFDNDDEFYRDLRRAKNQKLGRSIPPEQAQESAVQAEGDFLQAMRETKDEFQRAKEELGSDGAVNLFLERIREEDERQNEEN